MTALVVILMLLAAGAGAWAWHRWHQRSAAPPSSPGAIRASRAPTSRFTGKGLVPPPGPPRRRPVVAGAAAHARPRGRFSGAAYIPPNAIGLACGKPVAECKRGANCLCTH